RASSRMRPESARTRRMRGSEPSPPLLKTVTLCPSDASTAAVALHNSSLPPQFRFPLTKTTFIALFSFHSARSHRSHPCGRVVGVQARSDSLDLLCDRARPARRVELAVGKRFVAAACDLA